ncbi:trigger factor [Aquisalimonas asiatica]|uniref:Trigger factor n=1 Tax=Aquisalimonas asiatica TaxID=406100 RepID=A0A1H8QZ30_9GAMM|nr:trigger factor [Aquisalimonas asiatica]SEO59128.1 trigger factor [Aquisalimonas asiatica]
MQVTVETAEGLERKIRVQVPAERVDGEVQKRLKDMAGRVRLDGFRPGKVPMKVVQQRFGGQVRQEVLSEVVQQTYGEALQQESLQPAGSPNVDLKQGAESGDLEYEASFEIMPEFEVQGVGDMKLERPVADVNDEEIDKVLEDLRKQRATYNEADKAAEDGDQVVIDFHGTVDGEEFEGNQGEDTPVTLGANQMPPEFEEALVGLRAGEQKKIEYTFPENFPTEGIAGKTAVFETTVKSVKAPEYPELDDALAESVGLQEGGLQGLRDLIRSNLEREVERAQKAKLKEQVTDALAKANEIELPKALVDGEIESMQQQMRQRMQSQTGQAADDLELPADLFEEQARRRVTLGLVMNKLIADNSIQVDQDRVRQELQNMVAGHQNPQEMLQQYAQNREMMQGLEVSILEDQVVEWVAEQAQVEDKPTDLESLLNPQQAEAAEDGEASTEETSKEG